MSITPDGEEQIVWTCMWCGQINAFLWGEPGFADHDHTSRGTIYMECEFCEGVTMMERDT